MAAVNPIPDDYPRIAPYLVVDGAAAAIDFYRSVFGMTERLRIPMACGKVGHAELALGDALVMVADEAPEMGVHGPNAFGGAAVTVGIYVQDSDAVFQRALAAGATEIAPIQQAFYGDSCGPAQGPLGPCLDRGQPGRGRAARRDLSPLRGDVRRRLTPPPMLSRRPARRPCGCGSPSWSHARG